MPLPKSSISLSIASVRPSILATPSPISRTTPTFCLAGVVLTPAICASISCSRSAHMVSPQTSIVGHRIRSGSRLNHARDLKSFPPRRQAALHAAVINIAAHLDAHAADQRRILGENACSSPGRTHCFRLGLDVGLQIRRQRRGAFDFGGVPAQIQLHQPLKLRQKRQVTARLGLDALVCTTCRARSSSSSHSTRHRRNSCLPRAGLVCVFILADPVAPRPQLASRFPRPGAADLPASESCR